MCSLLIQTKAEDDEILQAVKDFVKIDYPEIDGGVEENVRAICVARLCKAIGIRCECNFKNAFFDFFSCIMGEVIVQKLGFRVKIDDYNLKYVKFEDVNLIYTASMFMENPNLDEAFINVYNLADKFKHLIAKIKKFS